MAFFSWREIFGRTSAPVPSSPPETFQLPYDLTETEWKALKEWRTSRTFEAYADVLDEVAKLHGEALLGSHSDHANMMFLKGVIHGLRRATLLVDEIQTQEEAFSHDRARRDRSRTRDSSSLYATPAFRRTSGT